MLCTVNAILSIPPNSAAARSCGAKCNSSVVALSWHFNSGCNTCPLIYRILERFAAVQKCDRHAGREHCRTTASNWCTGAGQPWTLRRNTNHQTAIESSCEWHIQVRIASLIAALRSALNQLARIITCCCALHCGGCITPPPRCTLALFSIHPSFVPDRLKL